MKRRNWTRTLLLGAGGLLVILVAAAVLMSNSRVLRPFVAARLSDTTGGIVTIDSFDWTSWGSAELRGVTLIAPGWKGAGSEVARIDRVSVEFDLASLLWGRLRIRNLQIAQLQLSAAEDPTHGHAYNFQSLGIVEGADRGGQSVIVDRATIHECAILFQRVQGDQSVEVLRVLATADLRPSPSDQSRSLLKIGQINGPFQLRGSIDQESLAFEVSAEGVSVDDNLGLVLPRTIRPFIEQADAAGSIRSATLSMVPGLPVHGTLEVADFRATLPMDTFETWVHYDSGVISPARGFPQVLMRTGVFELNGTKFACSKLDVELINTAGGAGSATLPVRASFRLDFETLLTKDFAWEDREQWVNRVRTFAPFNLHLTVPNFSLGQTESNRAIEVPRPVAEVMKMFAVTELAFAVEVEASRAAPAPNAAGELEARPVESLGKLLITDGRGAFEEFPYPLSNIQGTIDLEGLNAHITDLHGMGPSGQAVTISGDITQMGPGLGVDLSIKCANAPIDTALFGSFPLREGRLLADLFWQDGFRSMQEAGALFDPTQIQSARLELESIEAQLATLTTSSDADSGGIADLATSAGRLRRMIDHGSFVPGGQLAFDLRVFAAEGIGTEVEITGSIRILSADILATTFPYPIRAKQGAIVLHKDHINFGEGIPFETFDGATGVFDGRIDLFDIDGRPSVRPHLRFSLNDDQLNPRLFMAIPPGPNESAVGWPGKALSKGGTILSQLDPRGMLTLSGDIDYDSMGKLAVRCDIELRSGSVHPSVPTEELLASEGIFWPAGFGLDDCSGSFRLMKDTVEVNSFSGFRRDGRLDAQGRLALDGTSTDVSIQLRDIDLADYAINLLPFDNREHSTQLWERYQPVGQFDADISLRTPTSGGPAAAKVTVAPKSFAITLPTGSVHAEFESGTVTVEGTHVQCDALSGTIGAHGGLQSRICLDGTYGTDSGELDLVGTIEDGLLHGPLIDEIVERVDAEGARSILAEFRPEGRYDAEVAYSFVTGSPKGSFEIDAWIKDLSIGVDQARLSLGFPSWAHLHARGDSLRVDPFRAVFPGGSIEASGWLGTNDHGEVDEGDFSVDLHAIGTGAHVIGALPSTAREPLMAIGFECKDIMRAKLDLRVSRRNDSAHLDLDAGVTIHDASIDVGPTVSNLTASVALRASTDTAVTAFDAKLFDAKLKLAGRSLDDVTMHFSQHSTDPTLFIQDFHSSLATGVLTASATIGTRAPHAFEADIILSDVPLSSLIVPGEGVDTTTPTPNADPGLVNARVSIGGDGSGITSRIGRGRATVRRADLAKLPIGIALLQVTQLSLNLNPTVERAEFAFTIDQDRLQFQEFNLACKDLTLDGEGWLNTESTELALRLRNRGSMPILSDILGGISNQLFQIDVRGTLGVPIGSLAPLPALVPAPALTPRVPIASNQP